ncbi:hypothetical protein D915_000292 [Fasciola hepatica]|uniref:Uncharacterized protein n=1 Tax=Fasciola hepatica TaxID=6192 RepID=A0A4E0RYE4_FASHE|nr:hypothetical protein D915_000292 [Fasciola hepatica]
MPTFKLTIPSATLESGVEISRWNPRLPDNQVTVDLLFTRLRGLIATPTSGYIVTWNDGTTTHTVETDEDLQKAIHYFGQRKTPAERCVRLIAEPKDELDLYTALELLSTEMENTISTEEETKSKSANSESELFVDRTSEPEIQPNMKPWKSVENHCEQCKSFEQFEKERVRRVMARLRAVHQPSVSIEPLPVGSTIAKSGLNMIRDSRDHRRTYMNTESVLRKNMECSPNSPITSDLNQPSNTKTGTVKKVENETAKAKTVRPQTENNGGGKLTSEDIDRLCRKLFMMGFRFEEKTLRQVIKTHRGDVNKIIDDLSQMS